MIRLTLIILTAVTILCSWTKINPEHKSGISDNSSIIKSNDNELSFPTVPCKLKIKPLEKTDVIVLNNGTRISGKSTEVRIIEIKYLDAKGKIPIRILSIKRQ